MPRCKAATDELEDIAEVDFSAAAQEIVAQMRAHISAKAQPQQRDVLKRMKPDEVAVIEALIIDAFTTKKMGLLELSAYARRELAMAVIRGSVPKFRASLLSSPKGMGPAEYFIRYYRDLFTAFRLPANAINTIDPNLHFHLKRLKQFPQASRSLGHEKVAASPA
jgi:hypothetical protein